MFNRRFGEVNNDRIHEKIEVRGTIIRLKNPVLHFSYRDITQYFTKFDLYTEWCAENYFKSGKRKSKSIIIISIPYYFFKYYLADRNMLNGLNGFYWSVLMSFYHFVKYLKLEDMHQSEISLLSRRSKAFRKVIPVFRETSIFSGNAGIL